MKKYTIFFLLFFPLLLASCGQGMTGDNTAGDTLALNYARHLQIIESEDYTLVNLRNPWDTTAVLHRYALVPHGKEVPSVDDGVTVVRVPLQKAAVFTCVNCALLKELGVEAAIGGVTDVEYIDIPSIQASVKAGRVLDLGNGLEPNLERVMQLSPDALMPSPFQNSGGYGRLERIGIPIIECADYMEVSPLARAEWMRFYGRLFGVKEQADSLFAVVESKYNALKDQAAQVSHRPRLLVEKMSGASWYIPGGQSTMGILYHDAGAEYLWEDNTDSGSIPLTLEKVMEVGLDADVWVMKYYGTAPLSYDMLATENPAYRQFAPFRAHRIFGCNTASTAYYEETPFHPERLLQNLVDILHPELNIPAGKSYFTPLK